MTVSNKTSNVKQAARHGTFLEVKNLTKRFVSRHATVVALEDVSIISNPGEVLTIVGPSGCGKTTLLRILAGLEMPSAGSASVAGVAASDNIKTGKVSFVTQKPVLLPWRTVLDNVLLSAEVLRNRLSQEDRETAKALLESLGLDYFSNALPSQLSGGMYQRAALARALLVQPSLLLLDEFLSQLDEIARERLWLEFSSIWSQKKLNVVLATHSIREAVFLGSRLVVLSSRPGRIKDVINIPFLQPRTESVLSDPEFTELCDRVRSAIK